MLNNYYICSYATFAVILIHLLGNKAKNEYFCVCADLFGIRKQMKIAVPTRDGRVDDHFGHCAYYTIFDVIDGKVAGISKMASPEGCGCKSGIAPVLKQMGVVVMLAGNMGQGAKNVLEAQRIEVIRGCSGDVEELVAAYLAGNIQDNGEICAHHDCH